MWAYYNLRLHIIRFALFKWVQIWTVSNILYATKLSKSQRNTNMCVTYRLNGLSLNRRKSAFEMGSASSPSSLLHVPATETTVYWSSHCYCHAFFLSVSPISKHGKGLCASQRTVVGWGLICVARTTKIQRKWIICFYSLLYNFLILSRCLFKYIFLFSQLRIIEGLKYLCSSGAVPMFLDLPV